jgi:hypothetical protein
MERVIVKHHHVTERRAPSLEARALQEVASAVRLVKDGSSVKALEFTCACGERVTIELTYESNNQAATARPRT